ncbi:hypothetical protein So717_15060 [Roseobacter cerasinus]|uniref:DUF3306 domain-containing protein n=1 Tax=Roseobacter cerasinus TaxID=2602289 RepID=A0A640VNC9_9RHOB|nr:DUF3306 domain-containing protein [Roseobacter cerasinus]GFE49753.1 hypothetical protein So717_15060 [Roseobacter cerasinus]
MTDTTTFWGRRRAAVQAEADSEARREEEVRLAAAQAELAEKDDDTILRDMGLPDPEAMRAGDDFAAFMAKEVPTHLRNRALRTLWRSNPVLACVDGLNEYDDDYRAAMLAGGPVKTAYQVGKGMLSHIKEMARQEELAASDQSDIAEAPEAETPTVEETPEEVVETAPVEVAEAEAPDTIAPAPRRMQFRFEEAGA